MNRYKIGVISDTHGLLREEALNALKGSDLIIHAGDIGNPDILKELRKEAPVVAVRGNCDNSSWANELNITEAAEVGDVLLYVIHNINDLDLDPEASGFKVVISGHSHIPAIDRRDNVLFINPGSAGPRRFKLPVSVALINIDGISIEPQLFELLV